MGGSAHQHDAAARVAGDSRCVHNAALSNHKIQSCPAAGLRAWAAKHISATLAQVRLPQLALERVAIRNGDLWATLTGEAIPRHVEGVNLQLKLGRDYRTRTLDLSGLLTLHDGPTHPPLSRASL